MVSFHDFIIHWFSTNGITFGQSNDDFKLYISRSQVDMVVKAVLFASLGPSVLVCCPYPWPFRNASGGIFDWLFLLQLLSQAFFTSSVYNRKFCEERQFDKEAHLKPKII